MAKAVRTLDTADAREKIFIEIIGILARYNSIELKSIHEDTGIAMSTMYKWINGPTISPQIRTLATVARALGYEIVLKRTTGKVRRLRSVK